MAFVLLKLFQLFLRSVSLFSVFSSMLLKLFHRKCSDPGIFLGYDEVFLKPSYKASSFGTFVFSVAGIRFDRVLALCDIVD